jgi:hypothetical protein
MSLPSLKFLKQQQERTRVELLKPFRQIMEVNFVLISLLIFVSKKLSRGDLCSIQSTMAWIGV